MRKSRASIAVSHATCSAQYCHPHKLATWIIKVVFFISKTRTPWAQHVPSFSSVLQNKSLCNYLCCEKSERRVEE